MYMAGQIVVQLHNECFPLAMTVCELRASFYESFICLILYVPVNTFAVMSEWVALNQH